MNSINIEKRFDERLAVIRRAVEGLPAGKRNLILNNCDKLAVYARKAGRQLETAHIREPHRALYDARTNEDLANIADQKKRIWAALLAGRVLSLENAQEFGTSQMHTHFFYIRRDIEDRGLPYILCDEWVYPGEGRSKFKRYWLQHKLEEQQG